MPATRIEISKRLIKYLQLSGDQDGQALLPEILAEAEDLIEPWSFKERVYTEDFFKLFHPWAGQSRIICSLLEGSKYVWLMAAGLGPALEERSSEHFEKLEHFKGYILNRLGSWLAEEGMRKLDREVERQTVLSGFQATRRYSPGYKDFALQAQEVFYSIIRSKRPEIELHLSQAHILMPEKTVTALKGEFSPE